MTIKEFIKYLSGLPEELQELPLYVYVDELDGAGIPFFAPAEGVRTCLGRDPGVKDEDDVLLIGMELSHEPVSAAESLKALVDHKAEKERLETGVTVTKYILKRPLGTISTEWKADTSGNATDTDRYVASPYNETANGPATVSDVIRKIYEHLGTEYFRCSLITLCDVKKANPGDGKLADVTESVTASLFTSFEVNCVAKLHKTLPKLHPYLMHEVVRVVKESPREMPLLKKYTIYIDPARMILNPQPGGKE